MKSFNVVGKSEIGNPIATFEFEKSLGILYSKTYNNIDDAKNSPIVQKLFYLPFVKSVTLNNTSIQIERFNILEWEEVINEVSDQIENYLNSDGIIFNVEPTESKTPISIYAESTPNPSVMKFVANKKLVEKIKYSYGSQSIVCSIDIKNQKNKYKIFYSNGIKIFNKNFQEY